MKIGFVLDDSLDKTDGVQQYVLAISHWMHKHGHEIHYLVGETHREDLQNLHSLSKNVNVRFNANRLSIPLPAPRQNLKKLLVAQQFDILHVQMPHNPFLAGRVVKASPDKTAIVGTFHVAPFSKFETAATWLLGMWLKPNVRRFDSVVSVSKTAQDFAQKTFRIDSKIVPNPVIQKDFSKNTPNYAGPIVFLGRLVPRKGCLELLKAYKLLVELVDTPPKLIICGDGPQRKMLESFCNRHELIAVEFAGYVTEEEKRKYLASASLAVFPSLGGESFGIVLLEAMAAGAGVVLAGDNSGYKDVMRPIPEVIIRPNDSKTFAIRLHKYLTDSAAAKKVHQKQEKLVQSYDIDVVGSNVLKVYQEAIAKRSKSKHN